MEEKDRPVESDAELKREQSGLSVTRRRRTSSFSMPLDHYHRFYELYYLAAGRCRIFLNHTIYHLEPGSLILIEPMAIHHTIYGMVQENERIAVNFEVRFMERFLAECGQSLAKPLAERPFFQVEPGRRDYVEQLLSRLDAEQQSQDGFSALLQQGYLFELLAFLGRSSETVRHRQSGQLEQVPELAAQEAAIQEAARYIYHHFREPLTLPLVADRIHMSPAYFSRRFKQLTGFGYKEYLNDVRLKEASRMLLETDLPVMDVAQLCGFSDGNYFGDLFRREKGVSPRMYRKNPQIL